MLVIAALAAYLKKAGAAERLVALYTGAVDRDRREPGGCVSVPDAE